MKKITLPLLAMFFATLFFTSCGGPEADGKKLAKFACDLKTATTKNDTAAVAKINKDMEEFGKSIESKYEKDTAAQSKLMKAMEDGMKDCK